MTTTTPLPSGFYGLGIAPKLLQTLDRLQYTTPTPIQHQSIPIAIEGKDLMGIAQTGTGKTLAFGIPLLQRLAQTKGSGLVVLPTRELALQVEEALQRLGAGIGLRTVVLIGGASFEMQVRALKQRPHIYVVTPGRLIDHLDQRTIRLDDVSVLVLDEADRMLDMGFEPQLKRILQTVPAKRQTMLFSATMPPNIVKIANSYMQLPVRIEVAPAGKTADLVTQEVFMVKKEEKLALLQHVLEEHRGSVLVFSRTKHGAKNIARTVREMGHRSAEIHSNRSLAQRREALEGFKSGRYRVLVATDIAARGIDVKGIELVINYDLPDSSDDYVHRIGRTGRAGSMGKAISFATSDQRRDIRDIERLIKKLLPVSKTPELAPVKRVANVPEEAPAYGSRFPRRTAGGSSYRPGTGSSSYRSGPRSGSGSGGSGSSFGSSSYRGGGGSRFGSSSRPGSGSSYRSDSSRSDSGSAGTGSRSSSYRGGSRPAQGGVGGERREGGPSRRGPAKWGSKPSFRGGR